MQGGYRPYWSALQGAGRQKVAQASSLCPDKTGKTPFLSADKTGKMPVLFLPTRQARCLSYLGGGKPHLEKVRENG